MSRPEDGVQDKRQASLELATQRARLVKQLGTEAFWIKLRTGISLSLLCLLKPGTWIVETRLPLPFTLAALLGLSYCGAAFCPSLNAAAMWLSLVCTGLASLAIVSSLLRTLLGPPVFLLLTQVRYMLGLLHTSDDLPDTFTELAAFCASRGQHDAERFFLKATSDLRDIAAKSCQLEKEILALYARAEQVLELGKRALWQYVYVYRFGRLCCLLGICVLGFALIHYTLCARPGEHLGGLAERSFCSCLYFSVVTISTTGFGDIYPISRIAQLICAWEIVQGAVFLGVILAAAVAGHQGLTLAESTQCLPGDRKELRKSGEHLVREFCDRMDELKRLNAKWGEMVGQYGEWLAKVGTAPSSGGPRAGG